MKKRSTLPTRLTATALLGSAALVAATLTPLAGSAVAQDETDARGDAPAKRAPQGSVAGVYEHLINLEEIGDDHGDRAAGNPGYQASVDYVVKRLKKAGYKPQTQEFDFAFFEQVGEAAFEQTAPTPTTYVEETDYAVFTYSGSGDVTAPVEPVDLNLADLEDSTSGCEASDFDGFTAGNIALIRRGTCDFLTKAGNAETAGATGVVVMNQGNGEDRSGVVQGTLGEPGTTIPVVGISFATGESLAGEGVEAHLDVETESGTDQTWNVVAETRGNPRNVVMAGAHLDSVADGNGINDNGTGSAALLEVAEKMATAKKKPKNRVRFAWWGAEELGLLGSEHYVTDLAENRPTALQRIALYLNFDMVGSPNYALMVYDGDNSAFPVGDDAAEAPEGSAAIETMFHRFFDKLGTGSTETAFSGRSDYGPFIAENVPAGGLFTGAEDIKSEEEAELFGGTAGEAYDACYHQPCDNLGNVSRRALRANTAAMDHALRKYARNTRSVNGSASGHEPPAEPESAPRAARVVGSR